MRRINLQKIFCATGRILRRNMTWSVRSAFTQPRSALLTGQAAFTLVIFFLVVTLAVVFGFSRTALSQTAVSRNTVASKTSFASSESGIEDVAYRLRNFQNIDSSETLFVNNATVTTVSSKDPITSKTTVTATANEDNRIRKNSTIIQVSSEGYSFSYALQVGNLGLDLENDASVAGSVYSNGSIDGEASGNKPVIQGSAFVAPGNSCGNLAGPNMDLTVQNLPAGSDVPNCNAVSPSGSSVTPSENLRIRDTAERRKGAQSFVAPLTSQAHKIQFLVKNVGDPNSNLDVRIYKDDGSGNPDTFVSYASAPGSITKNNTQSSYGWTTVTLTNNVKTLVKGETYWIYLSDDDNSSSRYYVFGANSAEVTNHFKYSQTLGGPYSIPDGNPAGEPNGEVDLVYRLFLGEETNSIDGVIIGYQLLGCDYGSEAHAKEIYNSNVYAYSGYCDLASGNDGCHGAFTCTDAYDSQNVPIEDPPIPDDKITSWIGEIETACPSGVSCYYPSYTASGGTTYALPDTFSYIDGDLTVQSNGTVLELGGNVVVRGNALFSNECYIQSSSTSTRIIFVKGVIDINNNCLFGPDADPASGIILLISISDQVEFPDAITISNNASGPILFAQNGSVAIKNNVILKAVFGQKIKIENNAIIQYETGLANVKFSNSPSGSFVIESWQEVE